VLRRMWLIDRYLYHYEGIVATLPITARRSTTVRLWFRA